MYVGDKGPVAASIPSSCHRERILLTVKKSEKQKQSSSLMKETYSFFYFDRYALRRDYYTYKYTILFYIHPLFAFPNYLMEAK